MVERCRTPELVDDEETFAVKIQHLASKVKAQTFSLSNIKVADVLLNVLTAVREHHVKMEADFINTILSILILEGIGRQLNPELDLFQSALPILRSLGSKQINSPGSSPRQFGSMFKVSLLSFLFFSSSCILWSVFGPHRLGFLFFPLRSGSYSRRDISQVLRYQK
jgi:aarF domain-containing kinase